jgi:hypothetical protein
MTSFLVEYQTLDISFLGIYFKASNKILYYVISYIVVEKMILISYHIISFSKMLNYFDNNTDREKKVHKLQSILKKFKFF